MPSEFSLLNLLKRDPDEVITKGSSTSDIKEETGWDRLRRMFSLDEYGYQSREIVMITQATCVSTLAGGIIGSIIQSRETYVSFMENNQATKFLNHIDAKRELARVMYLAFGKGALRWGWRVGGFTFSYISLMTMTSVYYGKESVLDYVFAAGLTGGIWRANLGLKGIVSGTILGSALGLIGGTTSLLVLKSGGMSMNDIRDFSKTMAIARDEQIKAGAKAAMVEEYTDFIDSQSHDEGFQNLKSADK